MGIFQSLSSLALRSVVEGASHSINLSMGEAAVETVVGFLANHFIDHSQSLNRAMQNASGNAWKALEIALAGESLMSWFHSSDNKAFREQVRTFLNATPLSELPNTKGDFRQLCLAELRAARKKGLLDEPLDPHKLAREVGQFARFDDHEKMLRAEWYAIDQMASQFHNGNYPNLAHLVRMKVGETNTTDSSDESQGPPKASEQSLLIVAVRFFFRREVELDRQLYQGLSWAKLELIQTTHDHAFVGLHQALASNREHLELMLVSVEGVATETRDAVLSLHQRVAKLTEQLDVMNRAIQPKDSLSITGEHERQLVKQLIAQYRALPEQQRTQLPSLLNSIGKLEVATGAFQHAQEDFATVATLTTTSDEKAEAQFNLYRAALEQGDFEAALEAIQTAVTLDPHKYQPFPFKKYQAERILGAGGFGVAFLCRNRLSQSRLVVKALQTDTLDRTVHDVFQEAHILEELDHPGVIRLRDCDYAEDDVKRPYLVMDYFEGSNLEDYARLHGTIPLQELPSLVRQLAEALQAAHSRNILHRDVKPGNVLVRRRSDGTWKIKLIDFGLALKQNVIHSTVSTAQAHKSTVAYSITGTIDYAAPEQLGKLPGVPVGKYTDVYGLAKTCCYALFGTSVPLRKHWAQLPDVAADLLELCLLENPKDRIKDMSEVLTYVDRMQTTGAAKTPPPIPPKSPNLPGTAAIATPTPHAISVGDTDEVGPVAGLGGDNAHTTSAGTTSKEGIRRTTEWWKENDGQALPPGSIKLIHKLVGHQGVVVSAVFSPSGDKILSGGADKTLRVWDARTGKEMFVLSRHTEAVQKVAFLPGGRLAASASTDKSVRLWDLDRAEEVACAPSKTNGTLAFSPDGQYALTGNVHDPDIRLWEIKTGRALGRLKGQRGAVLSLAFSPNGRHALSGSADGTLQLWDVHSKRQLAVLRGHAGRVHCVTFLPDGRRGLSASADRTVRLWNFENKAEEQKFDGFHDAVWSVAVSSDGWLVACDDAQGSVRLWELESGTPYPPMRAHRAKVLCVNFSPDGKQLLCASEDGTIAVWSLGN
ncbi:MAG: protein kinase [Gemmataceae bacterium]